MAATPGTEQGANKEKLSDVLQRDCLQDEHDEAAQQQAKSWRHFTDKIVQLRFCMRSLAKKIATKFQRVHSQVCAECRCENQQVPQPRFIFRVVESTKSASMRVFSRNSSSGAGDSSRTVRLATMNVAMFSLASAVPGNVSCTLLNHATLEGYSSMDCYNPTFGSCPTPPLGALLLEPISPPADQVEAEAIATVFAHHHRSKVNPAFSPNPFYSFHSSPCIELGTPLFAKSFHKASVFEVLRDSKADLIALQEVRAEEEKGMSPLTDLAEALGMHYAYAESWAPEFGNAILSRWPIKSTSVKRIYNSSDYRNLLKVVVDVPSFGEVCYCCTHLDHLDEDWRIKQVSAILEDTKKVPHFLAGDLNSLNRPDYSQERWAEIAKASSFFQACQLRAENRKMAPRSDVMERLLVEKGYMDSCAVASPEIPALVRGQEIQGTCKHNTRIDYILASPHLQYRFIPGSYKVVSSRGTSDHHLVTVDIGWS
ncbi:uncharacterized protein LOC9656403 [Selaginella moellendorffii]|uniref:uncharacterized protein LOC9656403 n=1 Tax=Selaginella moellendorffii TaxID=88036 RepID=UPI000D1D04D0|nr:uncharacterized protein LOC9656403 [Selaginella moellendorffii]|eukprot:XP_024534790.1 uncharacterized protein LOC9656403 [Selaginella moellendorffii]